MKTLQTNSLIFFPGPKQARGETFRDLTEKWLAQKEKEVKPSTYMHYDFLIRRHLFPAWEHQDLRTLSNDQIEQYITLLLASGRVDGKGGLSATTVCGIATVLQSILDFGVQQKSCCVFRVSKPQKTWEISKKSVLTIEQQQHLENALYTTHPFDIGVLLTLHTGLRIGELCALRWRDIDLTHRRILVTATLQRIPRKGTEEKTEVVYGLPKTKASLREIPISPQLLQLLFLVKPAAQDKFFLTSSALPAEPRRYQYYFEKTLKNCGLPHINFHILRHTFATRCIEAGGDPKTVSALLGHQTVKTTLDCYVHPTFAQKEKLIQSL